MDVDVGEVRSEMTVLDLRALKAEIIAEVLQRTADDARMRARQDGDRRIRARAGDRPDGVA